MVKLRTRKSPARASNEDKENADDDETGVIASRSSSRVSFQGDATQLVFIEDVSQHTDKLTGYKKQKSSLASGRSGGRIGRSLRSVSIVEPATLEESISEPSQEDYDVHLTRQANDDEISDEGEVEGKSLFGFRTPKRSRNTPAKSTPREKSSKRGDSSTAADSEAKKGRGRSRKDPTTSAEVPVKRRGRPRKVEATTPYRLAARMDTNGDGGSDSDSADSDSDQSSVSSTSDSGRPVDRSASQSVPNMADEFFKAQSQKTVTSDHTLARLREDGMLDQTSLEEILQSRNNKYEDDVTQLLTEHRAMFRLWMLQLCLGFNLMLYGYGSKKKLIEEFRRKMCGNYNCVVINGFFPSLTLKNVLSAIVEDCLGIEHPTADMDSMLYIINQYLTEKDEALYIFVHSIDGPMVRLSAVQSALSSLAQMQNVHIIASVDHINAPLMWSQAMVTKYRWLWYDATTFEPYLEETSYENSLMTQQSGTLALRSMINVFKSLTPNAKNIFILMAKYHLDHCDNQAYIGIPFQMLYQKCRENFLVNSDQTLRTQLTEFRDHKLIKSRKGIDGAEHLYLPTDLSTLKDFMEQATDS